MKRSNIQTIAVCGLLSALTVLACFVTLPMFGLELCFAMVPVAVGAVLYGKRVGTLLGGVFGTVSFLQALGLMGYSPFLNALLAVDPFFTFVLCLPTRLLAGFLVGCLARLPGKRLPVAAACVAAPVFNTLLFMSAFLLLFWRSDPVVALRDTFGTADPFFFAVAFVGLQGVVEMAAGAVVGYPVCRATQTALRRFSHR